MTPITPSDVAHALRGQPDFTAEPGVGVVLLHRLDGSGRAVRLDMTEAVYAYVATPRALLALARRVIARDWRQEWKEMWRTLTTRPEDSIRVQVARRFTRRAATRVACGDHVRLMGIDQPVPPERPAFREARLSVSDVALPRRRCARRPF